MTHHLTSCTATICAVFLLISTVDTAETSTVRISRPNGLDLSSPVVVGTGQSLTIWCTAVNTGGTLWGLHWTFPDNSSVPEVSRNTSRSEYDVGMVHYRQHIVWIALLHMNRVQQSHAGIYKCIANFSGMPKKRSMEIQVLGGCPLK